MLEKSKYYLFALLLLVFLPMLLINSGIVVDDSLDFALLFVSFASCVCIPFIHALKYNFRIVFVLISIICSIINSLLLPIYDSTIQFAEGINQAVAFFALSIVGTISGFIINLIIHTVKKHELIRAYDVIVSE